MATILHCPHCGNAARTAKAVPHGAKITCNRCRKQFPYSPAPIESDPGEASTEPAIETIPLAELLDAEDRPSSGGRAGQRVAGRPPRQPLAVDDREARTLPVDEDEPKARYDSVTNSKIVDNPLSFAARSSKERLIGGKQVHFGESRYKVGVVLTVVIGGALYFGFWAYRALQQDIETAGQKAREARQKLGEAPGPDRSKPSGKGGSPGKSSGTGEVLAKPGGKGQTPTQAAPAPSTSPQALVKGNAGTPVKVGDWEVTLVKAELGRLEILGPIERLLITVRVTNLSAGSRVYRYWSQPGNGGTISNQNLTPIPLLRWREPKELERRLAAKESYDDVLVVDAGAAKFELDLTLNLPKGPGSGGCVIHLPPGFVKKLQ